MTPERMAELVARWVRFYTRDLPAPIAQRRADEIEADLRDHIAHERANGISAVRKNLHADTATTHCPRPEVIPGSDYSLPDDRAEDWVQRT
jgi:hypothetical protein